MALETTVFIFKISVPFEKWVQGFDSPEAVKMHEKAGMQTLFRGVSKDDPQSVIVIHQSEEGVARAMFDGAKEMIEASGHIYDSTVITSYFAS
tara:strand:+ start:1010 stop:1288 length:279 start_codon:yes stop_codon:yes gene_type:complete